jgi:MinD-like ATPase involved in chromosome partitioning or flagellar assembly
MNERAEATRVEYHTDKLIHYTKKTIASSVDVPAGLPFFNAMSHVRESRPHYFVIVTNPAAASIRTLHLATSYIFTHLPGKLRYNWRRVVVLGIDSIA